MTTRTSRTQCDEDYYHRSRPRAVGRSENPEGGGGVVLGRAWSLPFPHVGLGLICQNMGRGSPPDRSLRFLRPCIPLGPPREPTSITCFTDGASRKKNERENKFIRRSLCNIINWNYSLTDITIVLKACTSVVAYDPAEPGFSQGGPLS